MCESATLRGGRAKQLRTCTRRIAFVNKAGNHARRSEHTSALGLFGENHCQNRKVQLRCHTCCGLSSCRLASRPSGGSFVGFRLLDLLVAATADTYHLAYRDDGCSSCIRSLLFQRDRSISGGRGWKNGHLRSHGRNEAEADEAVSRSLTGRVWKCFDCHVFLALPPTACTRCSVSQPSTHGALLHGTFSLGAAKEK